jgi:hypothetical protein
MSEEPNFLDLVAILSITAETTLEKFGSTINASIFDASNIAGTLKQKALIEFTSYYPGPNTIVVTETGKKLIAEAETKATEPVDKLDETILFQLAGGKRFPNDIQTTLNISPKDLAMHLFKVNKQGLMSYELKSGNVNLLLTDKGFIKAAVKPPAPPSHPTAAAQQGAPTQSTMMQPQQTPHMQQTTYEQAMAQQQQQKPAGQQMQAGQQMPAAPRKGGGVVIIVGIALAIVIVVLALVFYHVINI